MNINYQEDQDKEDKESNLPEKIEKIRHDKKVIDQQIRLLQNRIGQLQNLDSLQQKKIKNRHQKIIKIVDVHNYKKELEQLKQQSQEQIQQVEQHHKLRAMTQRQKTVMQIQQLQEMQLLQKKQENLMIRQQRSVNEKEVQIQKLQEVKIKQNRARQVQEVIQQNQENINEYWKKRLKKFGEDKKMTLDNYLQQKDDRYQVLQRLIDYENIHIQKLQHSQKNLQKLDLVLKDQSIEKKKKFLSKVNTPRQQSIYNSIS